ncbi:hypothetical protein [Bordetella avium]|uniref:Phage membrane protein n=1 Tax=Bordetella avium (strain 197N) TaxID=360910 RepID=Q2L2Y5_BORA1|nr:hypothetical protein [Bordetella avium]CAJ48904.1 putative phage membrane protein [Bordetella avium 197N]
MRSSASPLSKSKVAICVTGAVAGYCFSTLPQPAQDAETLRVVFSSSAGILATLLGFLVSAGALLYAVSNTRLARNAQRTGHFGSLLGDLFFSALALFMALAIATSGLFLTSTLHASGQSSTVISCLIGFVVASLISLIPLGHKMWLLLSSIEPEDAKAME